MSRQEPEDAIFEVVETNKPKPTLRAASTRGTLTHSPYLERTTPNVVDIMGYRDDLTVFPWGFWGGGAAIVVLLGLVALRGTSGLFSLMDLLIALILGGAALVLFRWGPRDSLKPMQLARIDLEQNVLSWPGESGQAQFVLNAQDIQEIVFALIRFPVSPNRPDSRIHVYTLLVRDNQDQLIPVVEASPEDKALFDLGEMLSQWSQAPLRQVGEGILSG